MITSVTNKPKWYTHGYGPIVYGCVSDKKNSIDMSYVFDVYVRGSKVARILQPPNLAGTGVINISPIVQPYLEMKDSIEHEIEIATGATGDLFRVLDTQFAEVYVKVGEQYRLPVTTGALPAPLIIYNGLTATAGDPEYAIYSAYEDFASTCWGYQVDNLSGTTKTVSYTTCNGATGATSVNVLATRIVESCTQPSVSGVGFYNMSTIYSLTGASCALQFDFTNIGAIALPAAANINQAYTHQNLPIDYYPLGSFSEYVIPSGVTGITASALGKFLSMAGGTAIGATVYLGRNDIHTLTFINNNGQYSMGTGSTGYYQFPSRAKVNFYDDSDNVFLSQNIDQDTSTGGGPGATGAACTINPLYTKEEALTEFNVLSMDVSPRSLGVPGTCSKYVVYLEKTCGLTTSFPRSESVQFYIQEDCPQCNYERIRFSWLNSLGGRDYYNFTQFYELTRSQRSDNYYKDANDWSSDSWSLTPWSSGNTIYNKELERRIRVTTDWLTEADEVFLGSMFDSPDVKVWLPGATAYPEPCKVDTSSMSFKKHFNQKMVSVTFDISLSINDRVQTM
jgi:hypothetical protein